MNRTTRDLPAARKASEREQAKVKAENARHTLGSWTVLPEEADNEYLRIRGTRLGGRYKIANVHCVRYVGMYEAISKQEAEESLANARLIAAAPEMFAALQEVVEHWTSQFERRGHAAPEWCKKARAAISKAQGAPHE